MRGTRHSVLPLARRAVAGRGYLGRMYVDVDVDGGEGGVDGW